MQEGAERSYASAGADHDDRCVTCRRQAKFLVGLDVDRATVAGGGAIGKQGGADATTLTVVRTVADNRDRGVNFSSVCRGA